MESCIAAVNVDPELDDFADMFLDDDSRERVPGYLVGKEPPAGTTPPPPPEQEHGPSQYPYGSESVTAAAYPQAQLQQQQQQQHQSGCPQQAQEHSEGPFSSMATCGDYYAAQQLQPPQPLSLHPCTQPHSPAGALLVQGEPPGPCAVLPQCQAQWHLQQQQQQYDPQWEQQPQRWNHDVPGAATMTPVPLAQGQLSPYGLQQHLQQYPLLQPQPYTQPYTQQPYPQQLSLHAHPQQQAQAQPQSYPQQPQLPLQLALNYSPPFLQQPDFGPAVAAALPAHGQKPAWPYAMLPPAGAPTAAGAAAPAMPPPAAAGGWGLNTALYSGPQHPLSCAAAAFPGDAAASGQGGGGALLGPALGVPQQPPPRQPSRPPPQQQQQQAPQPGQHPAQQAPPPQQPQQPRLGRGRPHAQRQRLAQEQQQQQQLYERLYDLCKARREGGLSWGYKQLQDARETLLERPVHDALPVEALSQRFGGPNGSAAAPYEFVGPHALSAPHHLKSNGGLSTPAKCRVGVPLPAGAAPDRGGWVEGGWYVIVDENFTHCLQHHCVKRHECTKRDDHATHAVCKSFVVECVGVVPYVRTPQGRPQSEGQPTGPEAVGDDGCGGRLVEHRVPRKTDDVTVTLRFGTAWPALYVAKPPGPKRVCGSQRGRAAGRAAAPAGAAAAMAAAAAAGPAAAAAGPAAAARVQAQGHVQGSPASPAACARRGGRAAAPPPASAAAVATAAVAADAPLACAPAVADGVQRGVAGGSRATRQRTGAERQTRGSTGGAAGPGGPPTRAQTDADNAVLSVRSFLRLKSTDALFKKYLETELCDVDGRLDMRRVRALRDGHEKGHGILNIILHEAVELVEQWQAQQAAASPTPGASPLAGPSAAPAAATGVASTLTVAQAAEKQAELEARVVAMFEHLLRMWPFEGGGAAADGGGAAAGVAAGAEEVAASPTAQQRATWELLLQQESIALDTPVHTCCRHKLNTVLEWLLPRCTPEALVTPTKAGWTCLHTACRCGNTAGAVAVLQRMRQLRLVGGAPSVGPEWLESGAVILSDLTDFNKHYREHQGRSVLEAAIAQVWPPGDPDPRPAITVHVVGSEEELKRATEALARGLRGLALQ